MYTLHILQVYGSARSRDFARYNAILSLKGVTKNTRQQIVFGEGSVAITFLSTSEHRALVGQRFNLVVIDTDEPRESNTHDRAEFFRELPHRMVPSK